MGLVGLMSRATRTLACLAAGLSGVASSALPLHGASVAVAADENAHRSTQELVGVLRRDQRCAGIDASRHWLATHGLDGRLHSASPHLVGMLGDDGAHLAGFDGA